MKILFTFCLCLSSIMCFGQTTYTSKNYGISFIYPKVWDIKEGDLGGGDWELGYLGTIPMEFVAPGGVRVVTVKTPKDAYPGTDLGIAFFTVSLNEYLTQEECEQFPDDVSGIRKPVTKNVSGIAFHGLEQGGAAMSHQFGGTYYHGFSGGRCFELGEGVATSGYGSVDGMKKVDELKLFAILDRIVGGVTLRGKGHAVAASPSIGSFAVTHIAETSPTGNYRVSWDVKGAVADQVWLSASCSGDLNILEITDAGVEGAFFPCDVNQVTKAATGSLDLAFRNMSGGEAKTTVRLFAAGSPPVSRTLTTSLLPLPVIINISGAGELYAQGMPDKPFRMAAGQVFQIIGVGLLPKETLWIGPVSIPVECAEQKINFTSPTSLPSAEYPLFLTNERGKSDVLRIELIK
jgi:hypothetical protein